MKCVNLQKRFGREFRIEYEESYYAERTKKTLEDPWLMIMLCQHGHICPWGDNLLAACTDKNGSVANRLRKHPLITITQDADDGVNALFDVKHFDEIAAIMKPKRRRQVSEAERERLRQMGAKHHFKHGAEGRKTERPCVQAVPDGLGAVQGQTDAKSAARSDFTADVNLGSLPVGEEVVT